MTFEQWMKRVNVAVMGRVGCSVYDLPDCSFRDWFDDGLTPAEGAGEALAYAGEEDGIDLLGE